MKKMKYFFLLINIFLIFDFNVFANAQETLLNQFNDSTVKYYDTIKNSIKKSVRIVAVGDVMLGSNFPNESYLPHLNDCNFSLENVIPILRNADITFGNLEGCFLDHGTVVKKCNDTTKCFAFRMPVSFSECFSNAGFNMVSLANNHIGDFGKIGIDTTLYYLKKKSIKSAGLHENPFDTMVVNGIKIAMLACSPFKKTLNMNNYDSIQRLIKHLDTICDIIMVSFHGGGEGKDYLSITRNREFFYNEDRGNVWEFAHLVIDAGADLVIGHGPHVPRAIEVYKDRLICYSLGNFCTYARFNLNYPNCLVPIVNVELDVDGNLKTCQIVSAIQKGEGILFLDESKSALKLIEKLSKEDFPENKIVFNENGVIDFSNDQ